LGLRVPPASLWVRRDARAGISCLRVWGLGVGRVWGLGLEGLGLGI
jgi:hypothetical protein